jgi:hypothetical protein
MQSLDSCRLLRTALEKAAREWQPDSPRCILLATRESARKHTY